MSQVLTLNVVRLDSHLEFPPKYDEYMFNAYRALYEKGYRCLSQCKNNMTVICPNEHTWTGPIRQVTIPCNNCQPCWRQKGYTAAQKVAEIITARCGVQLSPYTATKLDIEIQCVKGHKFMINPTYIMRGKWCPICSENDVKKEKKGERKFYATLEANEAKALTPYINSSTKVMISCRNGHTYDQVPSSTNLGIGCRYCFGNARELGKEHFEKIVISKGGKILGSYINSHTKVPILCPEGHVFDIVPKTVSYGQWCAKCGNRETTRDVGNGMNKCPVRARTRFMTLISERGGKIHSPYITSAIKVSIECASGHIFEALPNSIGQGTWCAKCQNKCPVQARERFEATVILKKGVIIGPYVNSHTKVLIQCEKGHKFEIRPRSAVYNNSWCRSCRSHESKGECLIREYLTAHQIPYQHEVCFKWMPRKRYDFVFTYKETSYIIEFDGLQHFVQIDFFCPDEETFKKRRQTDIDKTVAALDAGYSVIRIAYSDIYNIPLIIENSINDPNPESNLALSDNDLYSWIREAVDCK